MRAIRRRSLLAFLVATFTTASLLAAIPAAIPGPAGFVSRNGADLMLDGSPFLFTGLNIPNANSDGTCFAAIDLDQALTDIGPDKAVMRAWFFQNMATTSGARNWSRFEATLATAASHNVRVIPVLANQWADCETGLGYKTKAWYQAGYQTVVDPDGTATYRDWVAEVVTRYKNNPTVAFWQLINEAEIQDVQGGDCALVSNAADTLRSWATDVSGLVKSIDPDHLVSLGTIGGGQCGTQGSEYKTVHNVPTIDLCEYHDYGSPAVPIPGDQFNGLQVRIDQCQQLDKPIFVGEAGIIANNVGGTLQARADAFAAKLDAQLQNSVSGFLTWAFIGSPSRLDNFDIGPGDPTLDVLTLEQVPPTPTGTGTDVTVVPTDSATGTNPVELTFGTVVTAGGTTLTTSSTGPAVPSGFQLGNPPTFYDLSTTATFTGPITVCISYDEAAFADESMARLLHFDGGAWVNATTSLDTVADVVCGVVSSLSPFAVAESLLVSFHIEGVIDQPVPPELAATFAVGDSFTVDYTFNRETVDTFLALKQAIYTDAITAATINVGVYTASGGSGNIHILNDWPNGPVELRDQYAATFGDLSGPKVGGFEPFDAGLQLQDFGAGGGDAIPTSAGEALPTAPLDPASFPVRFLSMSFVDPGCTFDCFPVSIQASVVSWTESITETVPPGGTVATNGTVTEENPFAASVTTPTGGEVTITEGDSDPAVPSSYEIVGDFFVEITADPASPADPLILRFLVDASAWGAIPLNELTVLRNGVPTPDCVVAGDSGPADPDPCVGERNILAGFDLEIVVRTSQASEWVLAIFSGTLADLIDQVEGIVDAGGLKEGQANGLVRILSNVERSLAKDKIGAACNQLQDFIDETENKVADGALEALDGADLVSTALGLRIFYEC